MSQKTNKQEKCLEEQLAEAVSSVAVALMLRSRATGSMVKGCTLTLQAPPMYLQDCVVSVSLNVRPVQHADRIFMAKLGESTSYPAMDAFLSILSAEPNGQSDQSKPSSPDQN